LIQTNVHVDPIDWRHGRSLKEPGSIVADIARLISHCAGEAATADEPIGILTHHLAHDEAVWGFCEELFNRFASHPGLRFLEADAMFVGADVSSGLNWRAAPP
jgi:hypothetical protein